MHLNVFIAKSGFCSRRKAAIYIKEGKASVNGKVVFQPWLDVKDADSVKVAGRHIKLKRDIYIIFNKPKGVTTTIEDKFAIKKVIDFIPEKMGRVYPVGRLDKFSRGLILLTNDGDLCYKLTHPKFEIEKEYIVMVIPKRKFSPGREIDSIVLEKLKKGIRDEDDILKVKSASIENRQGNKFWLRIIVCEGKKRHLRRLFEYLGFIVLDLRRIRIASLHLGDLKEGSFRLIEKKAIYPVRKPRPVTKRLCNRTRHLWRG